MSIDRNKQEQVMMVMTISTRALTEDVSTTMVNIYFPRLNFDREWHTRQRPDSYPVMREVRTILLHCL